MSTLLTVTDVANLLGISRNRVTEAVRSGELGSVRLGARTIRFLPEHVTEFVASKTVAPKAPRKRSMDADAAEKRGHSTGDKDTEEDLKALRLEMKKW